MMKYSRYSERKPLQGVLQSAELQITDGLILIRYHRMLRLILIPTKQRDLEYSWQRPTTVSFN